MLTDKKIYYPIRETKTSNLVIKELNAAILTATFDKIEGLQIGTLCKSMNGTLDIIGLNTCTPINSQIIKNILIKF